MIFWVRHWLSRPIPITIGPTRTRISRFDYAIITDLELDVQVRLSGSLINLRVSERATVRWRSTLDRGAVIDGRSLSAGHCRWLVLAVVVNVCVCGHGPVTSRAVVVSLTLLVTRTTHA